jgi:glutaminase
MPLILVVPAEPNADTAYSMNQESQLEEIVDHVCAKYAVLDEGEVPTYIPELGKANPNDFGLCLVGTDGKVFAACDRQQEFTNVGSSFMQWLSAG